MRLVDPRPDEWRSLFDLHARRLMTTLPDAAIEHIGSTAIGTIAAKDVVDILVGVAEETFGSDVGALQSLGYRLDGQRDRHAWLCWPTPENRQIIVHVVIADGGEWQRRIRFRDILRSDVSLAQAYEDLKRRAADATDDWTEYTGLKKDFVQRVLRIAPTG